MYSEAGKQGMHCLYTSERVDMIDSLVSRLFRQTSGV